MIVCISHLGWEQTLFQRPHHIMSRLAARGHRVLYLGAVGRAGVARLRDAHQPFEGSIGPDGASRFINHHFSPFSRFGLFTGPSFRKLSPPSPDIVWVYHPALYPVARALAPGRVVYDIMDRFDAFNKQSPNGAKEEARLITDAACVLAGGHSLAEAAMKTAREFGLDRPIKCLPSGIDLPHFQAALDDTTTEPAEFAHLERPIYGYFGAVDERMDHDCLATLAGAITVGTILLVGPVIGPPPPAHRRIVCVGPRPYAALPGILKLFSVALIPYRLDGAAAFASPTKTPEYLAGGRPVVSTAVPDVVRDYGDIIGIARTPEEFSSACRAAANGPAARPGLTAEAARRARTWDQVVEIMESELGLCPPPQTT